MSAVDLARTTLRALLDAGVREFVLSPGSRNTPLSLELAAADRAGLLRLHVRIDERTAGFLALGLAKAGGVPAAVVVTSGTAVANLHPAVIEAAMSHTPIAVVSANRPLSLLGTGANQTIDQVGIFGPAARATVHLDDGVPAEWVPLLADALTALTGSAAGPGPVQIDLGLNPPLVPPSLSSWPSAGPASPASPASPLSVDTSAVSSPTDPAGPSHPAGPDGPEVAAAPLRLDLPPRTLVVVAECGTALAASAVESALAAGFPVHVEAGSALAAAADGCLRAGSLLLRSELLRTHRPQHLVVVGRPTLSRPIPALAAAGDLDVTVISDQPGLSDALRTGRPAVRARTVRLAGAVDGAYAAAWHRADVAAAAVVDAATRTTYDAGAVTATVADARPQLLVLASSNPIRDLDERAVRRRQRVVVNRGAAGIDGLVSTAIGAALADQDCEAAATTAVGQPERPRALALIGDVAFLHDSTALVIGPDEPRPDLTIVVVNNDGGAIFAGLEQGAAEYDEHFERVFGTPHGVDVEALCRATATPYRRCRSTAELAAALAEPQGGIRVIEAEVSRTAERERRRAFVAGVVAAAEDAARG